MTKRAVPQLDLFAAPEPVKPVAQPKPEPTPIPETLHEGMKWSCHSMQQVYDFFGKHGFHPRHGGGYARGSGGNGRGFAYFNGEPGDYTVTIVSL